MRVLPGLMAALLLVPAGAVTVSAQDFGAIGTTETVPCPESFAAGAAFAKAGTEVEGQTYSCGVVVVPDNPFTATPGQLTVNVSGTTTFTLSNPSGSNNAQEAYVEEIVPDDGMTDPYWRFQGYAILQFATPADADDSVHIVMRDPQRARPVMIVDLNDGVDQAAFVPRPYVAADCTPMTWYLLDEGIPSELYARALQYLYTKETKSSFAIEGETVGKTREVTLIGEAQTASRVIEALEQSPMFQNASQKSNTRRGSQGTNEWYHIATELKPKALPAAVAAEVALLPAPSAAPIVVPSVVPAPAQASIPAEAGGKPGNVPVQPAPRVDAQPPAQAPAKPASTEPAPAPGTPRKLP